MLLWIHRRSPNTPEDCYNELNLQTAGSFCYVNVKALVEGQQHFCLISKIKNLLNQTDYYQMSMTYVREALKCRLTESS